MGLFGGSKRTSTTSTQVETTNISQGFEDIAGPVITGDNNVLTLSDQGAIDAGEAIARESLGLVSDYGGLLRAGFSDALAFSEGAARRERETLADALRLTETVATEQVTSGDSRVQSIARVALIAGAAVVGLLGLVYLRGQVR